jgi:MFS family permease
MLVLTSTSAQVAELGYVFSARSVGYLFGSMVGGPLFDKLDGNKLLALALFITSIGTHRRRCHFAAVVLLDAYRAVVCSGNALIPLVSNIWLLAALVTLIGLA